MKNSRKILSVLLALTMLFCPLLAKTAQAQTAGNASANTGKYVSEVFFANARTEDEARAWLTAHGYEPIKGNSDFNAGKASAFDKDMAVVMGIKRTDNKDDAITDMAVMNMTGGYSEPDYTTLVNKKKAEIDEFIGTYIPVIREFRDNYNGKGSAEGKTRADIAYEILNKFYDGDPSDPYAVSDTGMKLGDLLLLPTRQEIGEETYKALTAEQKLKTGDLQQIILESSGSVIIAIEQMLAYGADSGENTWLERLSELSGDKLVKNLSRYVPESAGQDVSPSAVTQFLRQYFADPARKIQTQYSDIRDEMLWFEEYCEKYGLWPEDDEDADAYASRMSDYFTALEKSDKTRYDEEYDRFAKGEILCNGLYDVSFKGDWGDTLGDFFNPADGTDYGLDADNFLVLAAAMSKGQQAALDMLTLEALLFLGFSDESGLSQAKPQIDSLFKDAETMSVYLGINRGIFRGGVALTSQALMDEKSGLGSAYDRLYDNTGIWAVTSYAAAAIGAVTFVAGFIMHAKGYTTHFGHNLQMSKAGVQKVYDRLMGRINYCKKMVALSQESIDNGFNVSTELAEWKEQLAKVQKEFDSHVSYKTTRMGTVGRTLMCIGGVLMIAAAFAKGYQLYKYYQRTFTPIPLMIVDEADIVSYGKDSQGNTVRQIDFDQYVYYTAARCNRQEVGEISDWQSGVSDYQSWGCGDVADLNGDFGQEWLVLYTVKSAKKGNPILADSLKLQYGSSTPPNGDYKGLHLFTYTSTVDLGDTAWSFSNKKNGVYFFWQEDENAYSNATASAFTKGHLALTGAGGLVVGLVAATMVLKKPVKKRKEEE